MQPLVPQAALLLPVLVLAVVVVLLLLQVSCWLLVVRLPWLSLLLPSRASVSAAGDDVPQLSKTCAW